MNTDPSIADHLPSDFNFYHLGKVSRAALPVSEFPLEESIEDVRDAFVYEILGEYERAWLVLLLDERLDRSTGSEIGNILAGRLAERMSAADEGMRVGISPPRSLRPAQLTRLLKGRQGVVRIPYSLNVAPQGSMELDVLLFSAPWEGATHV